MTGAQQTPWAGRDFFGSFFIFEKRVTRIVIDELLNVVMDSIGGISEIYKRFFTLFIPHFVQNDR